MISPQKQCPSNQPPRSKKRVCRLNSRSPIVACMLFWALATCPISWAQTLTLSDELKATLPPLSGYLNKKNGDLVIAVPDAIAPYAIAEQHRGIEVDIVNAALAQDGHRIALRYIPLGRLNHVLMEKTVDGAITVKEGFIDAAPIYFSQQPHIFYHNVVISHAEQELEIKQVAALANYSIAVFQNSDNYLGRQWIDMRRRSHHPISEIANQKSQIKMLFAKRVDTLVIDINIFNYYRQQLDHHQATPISVHKVFEKNYVKVAFRDEEIARSFDRGLETIIDNGLYQKILMHYRQQFSQ